MVKRKASNSSPVPPSMDTDLSTLIGGKTQYASLIKHVLKADGRNVKLLSTLNFGHTTKKQFIDDHAPNVATKKLLLEWIDEYNLNDLFKKTQRQKSQKRRRRLIESFDFKSMAVAPGEFELTSPFSETNPPSFIASQHWFQDIVNNILVNANEDPTDIHSDLQTVEPTMLTSPSRGGKTRGLYELIQKLQQRWPVPNHNNTYFKWERKTIDVTIPPKSFWGTGFSNSLEVNAYVDGCPITDLLLMGDEMKKINNIAVGTFEEANALMPNPGDLEDETIVEIIRYVPMTSSLIQIDLSKSGPMTLTSWENQQNPLVALCVRIAYAVRNQRQDNMASISFEQFRTFYQVDPTSLLHWLKEKPCILIIDELDQLNVTRDVALFLKKNFLIPAGRGLVFTSTTVAFNAIFASLTDESDGTWQFVPAFKLPEITTIGEAQQNFGRLASKLTVHQMLYFGNSPGLISTFLSKEEKMRSYQHRQEVVHSWLDSRDFDIGAVKKLLKSMLTGNSFDVPECLLEFMLADDPVEEPFLGTKNMVRWVPYHMEYILKEIAKKNHTIPEEMCQYLKTIAQFFETFKTCKYHPSAGDAWDVLFCITTLVKCLCYDCHDGDDATRKILPISNIRLHDASVNSNCPYMGDNSFAQSHDFRRFMNGIPSWVENVPAISVYLHGRYQFQVCDMIVAVWDQNGERSLYGYHCKDNESFNDDLPNKKLFDKNIVIRGDDDARKKRKREKWFCPTDEELDEFFGKSLRHWTPRAWKAIQALGDN